MKQLATLAAVVALSGCAARLTFIDRTDGAQYQGTTGSTMNNTGDAQAEIAGAKYQGQWIYSPSGGGFALGSAFGSATAYGGGGMVNAYGSSTSSTVFTSAHGRGLLTLRSDGDAFMRCVFDYNTMSSTGLGQCLRNDGREYDLTIGR
ncbi:hypothetical protein M8A51_25675 [Schlegelella sp. S2-27]|uniref:Outer membrane lipoprotein n=1 Tax=Caldimonas mangrovi TaxID=2944811 RepID=A0ABT0YW12_9BURK|nr:hypothetical protein [Caldimonas mangrovi]MCM5682927.1 hypothetical protein [Caldimonas mangrovi]